MLGWRKLGDGISVAILTATLASLTALSVGLSAPAHADIAPHDHDRVYAQCPARNMCVWQDSNYWGKFIRQVGGVRRPQVGPFLNDQISALWNRTGHVECVFQNEFYGGVWTPIRPGDSHHDLENEIFANGSGHSTGRMNDRISSWRGC